VKAIVYHRYGSPDVLRCEEVEKPTPSDDGVLIKVRAAAVNPLDEALIRGGGRIVNGLRKPKITRLGVDVAGEVEAVGRNVTQFKAGHEVFGACIRDPQDSALKVWIPQGAFAEYACVPESALVMKPDNVTFEQAASVPVAAFTALQGLRLGGLSNKGHIQPRQKVLINGAAGGVGTFAVQIAKSFGAEVTGVCSRKNVEMVRSIGADRVIDYTQEDFTKLRQQYDLLFDCIGNHSLSACRRALTPNGICVMVGEKSGRKVIVLLARLLAAFVLSRFVSQKLITFLAKPNKEDLTILHDLIKAGTVKPVIDRRYKLSEVPEAIRYLGAGHARGKVIITLD
jgi:NADPH:quinone reductase-like Zn-dependent oxidoreductase